MVVANDSMAASQKIDIIGQQLAPITLPDGSVVPNPGVATSQDLAPIAAMQMNIVAWGNSNNTEFTSGAGTIQYFSSTPMTAVWGAPTDLAAPNTITGETSNCT
nr:hypothetical protein [Mycobacterium sp.]